MRNIKPRYQGLMLSFSRNDRNQRYYLNGMLTCGPPVLIANFLLIVTGSNCNKVQLIMAISTAWVDAVTDSEDSTDSLGYL